MTRKIDKVRKEKGPDKKQKMPWKRKKKDQKKSQRQFS